MGKIKYSEPNSYFSKGALKILNGESKQKTTDKPKSKTVKKPKRK